MSRAYHDEYAALAQTRAALPPGVQDLISRGWRRFRAVGFPKSGRGGELWKYTNVGALTDARFAVNRAAKLTRAELTQDIPWNDDWTIVVFVDGCYSPALSNLPRREGLSVCGFDAAPELLEKQLGGCADDLDNAFVALNTAFIDGGAFIRLEPETQLAHPLQIVYVSSKTDNVSGYPRVLISAGAGSKSVVLETFAHRAGANRLMSHVGEIALEDGAEMEHYRAQLDATDAYHISHTRVRQGVNTKFRSVSLARGSALGRYDIKSHMTDERSACEMYGLYLTYGEQHQSNEIGVAHAKPHCLSRQFFKGILSGSSQAVFSGKVIVDKHAIKTDAQQKDLNLLLSTGAEIDTKPSLEIYADDVLCGHGATAGHLDEMTLFYLQSRGLSFDEAMKMQAYGFASEIVDMAQDETIAAFFAEQVERELPQLLNDSDFRRGG